MGFDQRPVDGIREQAVQVGVMHIRLRTVEFEVFPVANSGHQGDTEQVGQTEDRGTLRLRVSMHGVWSDRRLLLLTGRELKNLCCQDLAHLRRELLQAKERLRHRQTILQHCFAHALAEVSLSLTWSIKRFLLIPAKTVS